jgi:beta-glucosidase
MRSSIQSTYNRRSANNHALTARVQQTGGQIVYAAGTKIVTKDDSSFEEAVAAAKQADVVVMAVGEDAQWMSGEAVSRAISNFRETSSSF